jgi:hypothetical protein
MFTTHRDRIRSLEAQVRQERQARELLMAAVTSLQRELECEREMRGVSEDIEQVPAHGTAPLRGGGRRAGASVLQLPPGIHVTNRISGPSRAG